MFRLKLKNSKISRLPGSFFILLFWTFTQWASLCFAESLTVKQFLDQVSRTNSGYRGMMAESTGALSAAKGSLLMFKPQFFTTGQYTVDPRTRHAPGIEGEKTIERSFSVGVRDQTRFGLQLQFSLDYNQSSRQNIDPALVPNSSIVNFYFVPTFNFSLWQNFMGRMDKANQRLMEAQSLAAAYGNEFGARAILIDAEGKYWKLAVIREAIRLQKDSVDRAKSLMAIDAKKERQRLIDSTDVLLGEAAVQGKDLELRSMMDEERSAARALNSLRGLDSDLVNEELPLPTAQDALSWSYPSKITLRGDLRSAEQEMIAADSGQNIAKEKLLPSINLFGSIFAVGLNFSIPIDQSLVREAKDGYSKRAQAADLSYQRKLFEARNEWKDLTEKFSSTQERLRLALKLEEIQNRKFEETRKKKQRGLTVAFQVFQYELDLLGASLARLQMEGTLLGIRTQMKLYGEGDELS